MNIVFLLKIGHGFCPEGGVAEKSVSRFVHSTGDIWASLVVPLPSNPTCSSISSMRFHDFHRHFTFSHLPIFLQLFLMLNPLAEKCLQSKHRPGDASLGEWEKMAGSDWEPQWSTFMVRCFFHIPSGYVKIIQNSY